MPSKRKSQQDQVYWYFLLAAGVVILALAGYSGYVLYPRFDLPAVTGVSLLLLAAAAGVAAFFSPCSFPLLVTLLARQTGGRRQKTEGRGQREEGRRQKVAGPVVLRFALAFSLGVTLFLILAGGLIALGGGRLFAEVTFTSMAGRIIRAVVGVGLFVLGLAQVGLIRLPFDRVAVAASRLLPRRSQLQQRPSLWGYMLYGFGYLLAGFG
ncbi:MAG: cytochrome c biogenesis protein CcdA [Chloroflexota bacterium]